MKSHTWLCPHEMGTISLSSMFTLHILPIILVTKSTATVSESLCSSNSYAT